MNKRFVIYFFIISLLMVVALPVVNYKTYKQEGKYLSLFTIDIVETYLNYFFYKTFNRSLNPINVITGKDGFLFLGSDHDDVLHKTNGIIIPLPKDTEKFVTDLQNLQQWYESKGIQFIMVISPNPHSIYGEKLPDWIGRRPEKTLTDDIVASAKIHRVHLLDLRPILLAAKHDKLLYYKTDTHWNMLGASIAYNATIDFVNSIYHSHLGKSSYEIIDNIRGAGDLTGMLKMTSLFPDNFEKDFQYKFKKDYKVCFGIIDQVSAKLKPCNEVINPVYGINDGPKYVINPHSINKLKLLMLTDSMAFASSQLYNLTFATTWKWYFAHIKDETLAGFINTHHPDIVIYQIAERYLYFPDFYQVPLTNH